MNNLAVKEEGIVDRVYNETFVNDSMAIWEAITFIMRGDDEAANVYNEFCGEIGCAEMRVAVIQGICEPLVVGHNSIVKEGGDEWRFNGYFRSIDLDFIPQFLILAAKHYEHELSLTNDLAIEIAREVLASSNENCYHPSQNQR
jgi:hypothetical protein